MNDRFMLVAELEDYLRISKWTIYRWIKEKGFPVYKIGGKNLYRKNEVDEWVKQFKKA